MKCSKDKSDKIKETLMATRNKRKNQICKVFELKILDNHLTKLQKEQLKMLFVECKWLYNHILNWSNNNPNKKISEFDILHCYCVKHFDKNKNEIDSVLNRVGSIVKNGLIKGIISSTKTLATLKKKGLQVPGKLKFISEYTSIDLNKYGHAYSISKKGKLILPKIHGKITVRGLDQIKNISGIEFANAKLLNTPKGYYIKITTYQPKENFINQKPKLEPIGVDFGCKTAFTLSNGEKINSMFEESERIKKLQKRLTKQVKGSNRYWKTRKLLQKAYQKLSNCKDDFSNKIVAKLKEHELIVIQDEQLKVWHKSGHGKAIQHSILGRVKAKLKNLPQTVVLAKNIPTTKLCTNCGKLNNMPERKRVYQCSCGVDEDRDVHAAQNMLWIYFLVREYLANKDALPTEYRKVTREEFLTAIKIIFPEYSGGKLAQLSNAVEDCNEDVGQIIRDEFYEQVKKLFETKSCESSIKITNKIEPRIYEDA